MANHGILDKKEGRSFCWEEMQDMEVRRRGIEMASPNLGVLDAGVNAR